MIGELGYCHAIRRSACAHFVVAAGASRITTVTCRPHIELVMAAVGIMPLQAETSWLGKDRRRQRQPGGPGITHRGRGPAGPEEGQEEELQDPRINHILITIQVSGPAQVIRVPHISQVIQLEVRLWSLMQMDHMDLIMPQHQ